MIKRGGPASHYTNSLSLANFVGIVVGFFNVLLPGVHPQRGHNKNRSFPYRWATPLWRGAHTSPPPPSRRLVILWKRNGIKI